MHITIETLRPRRPTGRRRRRRASKIPRRRRRGTVRRRALPAAPGTWGFLTRRILTARKILLQPKSRRAASSWAAARATAWAAPLLDYSRDLPITLELTRARRWRRTAP